MTALDAALDYARMGLFVFPCNGKQPLVQWGTESTTRPETIHKWWTQWPDAGVGIDCGRSGLVVIDLDVKNNADGPSNWRRRLNGHPIPATFNVRTPSGGWHGWYRDPAGKYRNSAGQIAPGVDVRAVGGYVLAPGSPGYRWHGEIPIGLGDVPVMPDGVIPASTTVSPVGHWSKLDRSELDPLDLAALEALEQLGGHDACRSGDYITITRPKKMAGTSASIGHIRPGVVRVFTSNWDRLPEGVHDLDQLIQFAQPQAITQQATPRTVAECHTVFRRWFGDEYDLDILDVMLCALAAQRLPGDPLWVLIISGPGAAKTETAQACIGTGAIIESTISGEAALLSGTPKKDRAKDATGGLLRRLGDAGVLVIKDMTSVLSMSRDRRAEVLAALREIHDGHWSRSIGAEGGRTLTWKGRIVIIGAVTTAWDTAHAVVSAMGDRFVSVRLDSTGGRLSAYRHTMANTGDEITMRAELSAAVADVIAGTNETAELALIEEEIEALGSAANVVTLARTGVEYDYKGDVIEAHAPEMPTRFARQLQQIVRGGLALGMDRFTALRLAIRAARDSMPPIRLAIIDDVAAHPESRPGEIRRRIDLPWRTVDRQCQALHMLDVLDCDEYEESPGKSVWRYRLAKGIDPEALKPSPDLATPTLRPNRSKDNDQEKVDPLRDPPAKSGDAPPQVRRCSICGKPLGEYYLKIGRTTHPGCYK